MKKVRFESPVKALGFVKMNDSECHSPRPFIDVRQPTPAPNICYNYPVPVLYSSDPIDRFDFSNSSPYPRALQSSGSNINQISQWKPSNDLELSMLDASQHKSRPPVSYGQLDTQKYIDAVQQYTITSPIHMKQPVLLPIENKSDMKTSNILQKDNDFFIRRDNLNKKDVDFSPLQSRFGRLTIDKENNVQAEKSQIVKITSMPTSYDKVYNAPIPMPPAINDVCRCHHCIHTVQKYPFYVEHNNTPHVDTLVPETCTKAPLLQVNAQCHCTMVPLIQKCHQMPDSKPCDETEQQSPKPQNAVDKKAWLIQKYEENKRCTEIEKQTNVVKKKREPTVADLFQIIKLQNEQLQLLQEKVDKFISTSQNNPRTTPIESYTERVALETLNTDEHKNSIGVMTSFEMVRTSTFINKEILTKENAQVQCNRSQISIKEVVKSQPVSSNFLEGIIPVQGEEVQTENSQKIGNNKRKDTDTINEEKTYNEVSLYNVHVDATTPLISPEQSLYLDVRDYSNSESESDEQSNVGWTYYNKVMTHVNGMLQDTDMPSSASALYRNTRQQCMQLQVEKTNASVMKRVKFGDDPLGVHQPHIYASTDTSLKMNQLAAKYLKNVASTQLTQRPAPKTQPMAFDMSFATRNYMERHRLLQGQPSTSRSPAAGEIPRFLDITALKQQPKLL